MNAASIGPLAALGFVAGSALFWLQYWDLKDRKRPEPRRLLVGAFLLGIGAAFVAIAALIAAAAAGLPDGPGTAGEHALVFCFLVVGPIEEGAKFLAARTVVFRWKAFDEPLDGLVYGAAIALGFASLENLLYLPTMSWLEGVLRTLASPLTHTIFAAVWALPTAHGLLRARSAAARWAWQAGGLAAAALLHGAYDYLVVVRGMTLVAALGVAAVWIAVIVWARRALDRG